MKKILLLILVLLFFPSEVFAATSASQTVTATLTRPGGGGGGGGGGGAVAIGVGGGAVAAGGAAAFAPLLLAGLSPNSIIAAAAPLDCIACRECFLQKAMMDHFGVPDINSATAALNCNPCKIYFAQNDSKILNGTYDLQGITLPNSLLNAREVRVNVTLASEVYAEVKGEPELKLAIYKDISQADLRKKFETQQFTRYYMMKKYDIPLLANLQSSCNGLQKLSGMLDISKMKNKKQLPIKKLV